MIFKRPPRLQVMRLPSICGHPLSLYWSALVHKSDLWTSLWTNSVRSERLITREKPRIATAFQNGHGWFRTTDLSRLKRLRESARKAGNTGGTGDYERAGRGRMYADVRGCMRLVAQETDLCHFRCRW